MQNQQQRQIRGLALSQQMRLSLDLLHMGGARLRRRLRLEAARNPCLELVETPEALTARQALAAQIGLLRLTRHEADLAQALVHCLDERGWLADPLPEIAGWLAVPAARIEALLPVLQGLDPPGIFARDLAECLRLQLRARGRLDPMIERLLQRLDLAASGDLAAIRAHCGCDAEDAAGMLADLRALSPFPLSEDMTPPMAPELELTADGRVLPLDAPAPTLRAGAGAAGQAALARALIAGCEARGASLLRIASALAEAQADWLRGQGALRALTMAQLAGRLGLATSTVSRAVAGVAMRTPRGTVLLRQLLRIPASPRNPDLSRGEAQEALRRLIADWPAGQRISDAALAQRLAGQGIALSRRTVAKYRAEMGLAARGRR
ncbi:MAG: RNA polymerase subunit sigma-54 [Paracoccus sp. BP8]|nr:MAG: RNA polymerase subunit sigma-54 [Paracoccus sp. BP8]